MSPINVLSQNAKIVVDTDKTVTIDEVFNMISNQSDYKFIYHADLFKNLPLVHLKKGTIKANKLLEKSLSSSNVIFEFTNKNTIVIKEKPPVIEEHPEITDPLQQIIIKGTVVDESGQPLPGVNVIVKGSKTGVSTDFNGDYELKLNNKDEDTILVFSYVGFKNQEIVIGTKTTIDVKMVTNLSGLEEVVVIGYGTSKVKDATGVISRVSAKEIEDAPAGASIESLLQGKAAGVNVQIQSASPTSPISVIIRGASSLDGDNQPLWVIDGIAQASSTTSGNIENTLYNLNLQDVQSIDILKDASATAVYGSRAAHGVVIVTTKRGVPNTKPQFEVSTSISNVVTDYNSFEYFDAPQYIDYVTASSKDHILSAGFQYFNSNYIDEEAFWALNTSEYDASDLQVLPGAFHDGNTPWQDIITQNPLNVDYNFSVRGGSERTTYFVSFNHQDTEGSIVTGFSKRYTGRINFETSINDNIKFGVNLTGSTRKTSDKDGLLFTLRGISPDFKEYNDDGSIYTPDYYIENPHSSLLNTNSGKGINFSGTAFIELKLINNLKFRSSFSNTYADSERLSYKRIGTYVTDQGERYWSDSKSSRDAFENTLTYAALLNNKHDIKVLAGYTLEENVSGRYLMEAYNFPDDDILNNFGSQANIDDIDESRTSSALLSQFGRVHYKYDDRYIISGTLRRDGSSRFGADKRWGTFPSVAAAWLITGEKFMQSEKIKKYVTYLKLRTSMGITGSQNLGNFDWVTGVDATTYNDSPAIYPNSLGNPDLQWEETTMFDFGLDFGLLDDRIAGSVGIYHKESDKLIYDDDIPWNSAERDISSNVASMEAKGFEFNVKYDILRTNNHRLTFDFNYATTASKILKINNNQEQLIFPGSYAPRMVVNAGDEIGEWFGYQTAGRFYVTAEDAYSMRNNTTSSGNPDYFNTDTETVGDLIYIDQDGDGKITEEGDRVNLGTSIPKGYGGFGLTYTYKAFRLNTTFTYAYGHKRYWSLPNDDVGGFGDKNSSNLIAGESTIVMSPYEASFPRITPDGIGGNDLFSDFYLHNASYLRLNALNLYYKLPNKFFNNSILNGVELNFKATNLLTITKYPGFSPDGGGSAYTNVDSGAGDDSSTYPTAKVYSLGIKLKLN
ncbi:SusC/RagA family TonB-linked outer membrane protein [Lutibacter sp. A64]|uniref:SusC/RagA family TonB-linked outer membrane protein n=1 Tax=Lutibacter sp. A64 TaxID=2918526 RepID=UPI001F064FA5|nr:SusC/RagA family TonB-linked outer membrane protein [Lutibacter sp. A64]UMB52425.1 SusC/RagA family TonB-linked outer membrane protein [Lutibacter sp. A64]